MDSKTKYRLQNSRSTKQLEFLKAKGKKYVNWTLTQDQVQFYSELYTVVPYLVSFRTRKFTNINHIKNKVLRELHYGFKQGKTFYTCPYKNITDEDLELFEAYGIKHRIVKYTIVL